MKNGALLLGLLLLTGAAQASATHGITFTDDSAAKYFRNPTGTFCINSGSDDQFRRIHHRAQVLHSGGLIAKRYTIDLVSREFSSGYVDTGNWAVTKAPVTPPTTTPEPSSAGILFAGLVASGLLIRRRRSA